MSLLTFIYILVVGLAFLFSLNSLRLNLTGHLKLFSLLLGLTFLVEVSSILIPWHFHYKNNTWLYNGFTLIEFWTYAYYYKMIIKTTWIQKGLTVFLYTFPVFWFITVFFIFGFKNWNSYVIVVGALFTILFSLGYYYQLLTSEKIVRLSRHPEFWIATGMLVLYSCQLPYFGMLNFLVKNYLPLAKKLMNVVTIMNIFMYCTFIYAYICKTIIKK